MNLLNNLFNSDDIEITKVNKRYFFFVMFFIIAMIIILVIPKEMYYQNSFSFLDEEIVLLVEKDYINNIQNKKEIFINSVKCDYQIDTIEPVDDSFLVKIRLNNNLKNINHGTYKVLLGKESLFNYIIRIIKK